MANPLPPLPRSWSELTWQQLIDCWQVKIRYGGSADIARAAALLKLCGLEPTDISAFRHFDKAKGRYSDTTGETIYHLLSSDGILRSTTARELSLMAKKTIPWFDFPYGDPGEKEKRDEKGKVIKERREGVRGYVSNMRDAMVLPITETEVGGIQFALPQAACTNLTWEQYMVLKSIVPQLFEDGITEEQAADYQAQFMANCLVPAQDAEPTSDKFGTKYVFKYDSLRAERTITFWKKQLPSCPTLFHICFQVYQTAIGYYAAVYPLLFNGGGRNDPLQDALTGEIATIDAIMMEAHYTSQQEVYDTDIPFILDILNTMTKKAKEIEKMNAKIKKK